MVRDVQNDKPTAEEWERPAALRRVARWIPLLALVGLAAIAAGAASVWWERDEQATLPVREHHQEATPFPRPPDHSVALQAAGTAEAISPGPLRPRWLHAMAWTGLCPERLRPPACGEILVWGGVSADGQPLTDGAAYNPDLDRWRPIADAPRSSLKYHALPSVWTGSAPGTVSRLGGGGELIVWGVPEHDPDRPGRDMSASASGLAYDPVQDRWRILPPAPIEPRLDHSLHWTGSEVLVWGGRSVLETGGWQPRGDGAAYDPESDAWRLLPEAPLEPRWGHAGVSASGGAVIWGGAAPGGGRGARTLVDGAVYDAVDDRWRMLPPFPVEGALAAAPPPRATGVLAGTGLVVSPPFPADDGRQLLAWHPLMEGHEWQLVGDVPMQHRRSSRVVTVGSEAVALWGADRELPNGAVLHLSDVQWRSLPPAETPAGLGEAVVWTGSQLFVWGGGNPDRPRRIAYALNP